MARYTEYDANSHLPVSGTVSCSRCPAWYCSKVCQEAARKQGHKSFCGKPPICLASPELFDFVRAIKAGGEAESIEHATVDNTMKDTDEDNDDGSWESFDSDASDESQQAYSRQTLRIIEFFEKIDGGR